MAYFGTRPGQHVLGGVEMGQRVAGVPHHEAGVMAGLGYLGGH